MEAIVQYRTLLRNLQSCGLIEPKAVEKWERQVARVSEPGQSFAVVDSNGADACLSRCSCSFLTGREKTSKSRAGEARAGKRATASILSDSQTCRDCVGSYCMSDDGDGENTGLVKLHRQR
jgi:hypothetical protein